MRYGAERAARKAVFLTFLAIPGLAGADALQITALGDSLTHGYGLPVEDGFVPQMQAWLEARGHEVEITNAGVSGDTTAGGLARTEWSLTPKTDAMIVALGGNDFLRGIDPAVSRANLEGILKIAQARGLPVLLVGLVASGNYGPDYKRAFDAMYPELARKYGALWHKSFFIGLGRADDPGIVDQALMQRDGIHPSAEGVARIVEAMGPRVEELLDRARK